MFIIKLNSLPGNKIRIFGKNSRCPFNQKDIPLLLLYHTPTALYILVIWPEYMFLRIFMFVTSG